MKMIIQTVPSEKCKKQPLWWYGGASLPPAIDAQAYVEILERCMLPSKTKTFPRNSMSISAGQCRPHSAQVTTAWLHRRRVCVLDWPVCHPDLSPIENVQSIMMRRIRQRHHGLMSSSSLVHQEWGKNPLKLQQLISSTITKCHFKKRSCLSQLFWVLEKVERKWSTPEPYNYFQSDLN